MSKWKEGGGMQQSGQTADGTNNTTHSRLWLLIGPWWAFKQALLLTWQSAQHSSIMPSGRQKSCWTTANIHERWILFWWHLAAFTATPVHYDNSTSPTQWQEFSSWSTTMALSSVAVAERQACVRRTGWLSIYGQVHGLQTSQHSKLKGHFDRSRESQL